MIRIGITGQAGFLGTHLYNTIKLYSDEFTCVPFQDSFFEKEEELNGFVMRCDVIIHLAAMNRHEDQQVIYDTNIRLVRQLVEAMEAMNVKPYVLFSSSTQEDFDNLYGKSKREGRELLECWANAQKSSFTGLVVPNVFGPFCKPNYNSFVATFCHKLTHGETPLIQTDSSVKLIYVGSLCHFILDNIRQTLRSSENAIARTIVPHDFEGSVSELLLILETYKTLYFEQGFIPVLKDRNEINLFNTFRSYIDYGVHFPKYLVKHTDSRGMFVETIKIGTGGQVSFSTTVPEITRGNHFHTRKIERFTVIKGKARIQLRRIGTDEVLNFNLDGENPSYVDMPVWYTHNITNVGDTDLYTQFWINEWYNPEDGDTYFEEV